MDFSEVFLPSGHQCALHGFSTGCFIGRERLRERLMDLQAEKH
jgi:hypothetical protein